MKSEKEISEYSNKIGLVVIQVKQAEKNSNYYEELAWKE